MIEVQHLTRLCGKKTAVEDVCLKIRNGRIYGLVGPAGAGKSTVMNLIAGCLSPTSGTVLINGYDMEKHPKEAKRQIGYMPEQSPLFVDMTPREYLEFVAEAKGVRDEQLDRQVRDVLTVADLWNVQNTLIRHLPEGVRRRVGLAQTLIGSPDILILDEPLSGLDPASTRELRMLIGRIGEKQTVLVSAPTAAELGGMCNHVITLAAGRVVADEDVEAEPVPPDVNADSDSVDVEGEIGDFEAIREEVAD